MELEDRTSSWAERASLAGISPLHEAIEPCAGDAASIGRRRAKQAAGSRTRADERTRVQEQVHASSPL